MSQRQQQIEINRKAAHFLKEQATEVIENHGDFEAAATLLRRALVRLFGDGVSTSFYKKCLRDVEQAKEAAECIKQAEILIKGKLFDEADLKFDEALRLSQMNKIVRIVNDSKLRHDEFQQYCHARRNLGTAKEKLKRWNLREVDFEEILKFLDTISNFKGIQEDIDDVKLDTLRRFGSMLQENGKTLEDGGGIPPEEIQKHHEKTVRVLKLAENLHSIPETQEALKVASARLDGNIAFNKGVLGEEMGLRCLEDGHVDKCCGFYEEAYNGYSEALNKFEAAGANFMKEIEFLKKEVEEMTVVVANTRLLDLKKKIEESDYGKRENLE